MWCNGKWTVCNGKCWAWREQNMIWLMPLWGEDWHWSWLDAVGCIGRKEEADDDPALWYEFQQTVELDLKSTLWATIWFARFHIDPSLSQLLEMITVLFWSLLPEGCSLLTIFKKEGTDWCRKYGVNSLHHASKNVYVLKLMHKSEQAKCTL